MSDLSDNHELEKSLNESKIENGCHAIQSSWIVSFFMNEWNLISPPTPPKNTDNNMWLVYVSHRDLNSVLCLLDVGSDVGLILMKWVYTDKAEIPRDESFLIQLVKAANKYKLNELRER